MRIALLLALLTACVTPEEQAAQQQRDEEVRRQVLAAQQRQADEKRATEASRMAEWRSLCGPDQLLPRTYKQEMGCAWFIWNYEPDKGAAMEHWRRAAILAATRDEVCPPIEQIMLRSARPQSDLEGVDGSAVAACVAQRQAAAQATQQVDACNEQCRQEALHCSDIVRLNQEGLIGALGCKAARERCEDHCH